MFDSGVANMTPNPEFVFNLFRIMDSCRVKLGGIRRLLSDCGAEARYSEWSNQINSRSDQLVCPQPRRSFNGRSFRMQEGDLDLDILASIAVEVLPQFHKIFIS
jgi:hypothetical protein